MISTFAQLQEWLKPLAYKVFFGVYDSIPKVHPQLFQMLGSQKCGEIWTKMPGLGGLDPIGEAEPIKYRDTVTGRTIVVIHRRFATGFMIPWTTIKDAEGEGKIRNMTQQYSETWGEGVATLEETETAKIFNRGAVATGDPIFDKQKTGFYDDPYPGFIYDGQTFFSAGHTSKAGTIYSNTGSTALDTIANLNSVLNKIKDTNAFNEMDQKISIRPDSLVVPIPLELTAKTLMESVGLPGGNYNDKNVLAGALNVVPWSYLTAVNAWAVGQAKKGLLFFDREPVHIEMADDFDTKVVKVTIERRFGIGVDDWRYWVGQNFTT